ncbi:MAG: nucleotidyltransferase family protein [Sedimenticola sp.]|nr:nucleotidyltransferase family protein [Sedimenticola sp.]
MKPSIAYKRHRAAIRSIVEEHHAKNPRIFGSVLHGEDTDQSDLDILVDPTENTSLFDIGAISIELSELLGVEVDVLTPAALPDRWRMEVLNQAEAV